MMKKLSSEQNKRVLLTLKQIVAAIDQLTDWNKNIKSSNEYLTSSEGAKLLAASCMLIEGIGEGVKRINQLTEGEMFKLRPEIPWEQVSGMRNHIAHGYFEIDEEVIFDTIKTELQPLKVAIEFIINQL